MADINDRFDRNVLVVRCQTGDRAAFEELVTGYQARLHYFLYKMLHRKQDVDDVLQEVWLTVFRDLPRLADVDAFPAWLYQIARHRALRELRKPWQPGSLEGLDPPATNEEEPSFAAEDAARVHAVLDQLGPEHREALLLRFMEDMSYQDIARVIGCPLGTVRSRLHYAKHALKSALERSNVHE